MFSLMNYETKNVSRIFLLFNTFTVVHPSTPRPPAPPPRLPPHTETRDRPSSSFSHCNTH